eukprot:CAMPEP_0179312996 /NCGR_PEP_ID=MMETSP0797-20121207/53576_1 /TAXON_ID=47934 /ORGANISM="Dinophysis acuminata, Strain DAEP01" /LENGTH=158 /DNA_ID=CAMNT_0021022991 /DNA_START=295 /DNA_END=771 /DNA_ORIENTATION=-
MDWVSPYWPMDESAAPLSLISDCKLGGLNVRQDFVCVGMLIQCHRDLIRRDGNSGPDDVLDGANDRRISQQLYSVRHLQLHAELEDDASSSSSLVAASLLVAASVLAALGYRFCTSPTAAGVFAVCSFRAGGNVGVGVGFGFGASQRSLRGHVEASAW